MEIEQASSRWLYELETLEGKSANTIRTYGVAINHFLRYLEEIGKADTAEILPDDVSNCAEWLQEESPVAHRSLVGYVTTQSMFLDWLALEELTTLEVSAWQRLQKRLTRMRKGVDEDRKPRLPDEDDVQRALSAAQAAEGNTQRKQLIALRDRAIAEALRSTGARVSEVAGLKRKDLRNKTAEVRGKGNKLRTIFFDTRSWGAIQTYLAERDKAQLTIIDPEPIFSRHDRRASRRCLPLTTNSFRRIIDDLCKAGGAEHLTPHQFRHRFATIAIADMDLALVQDLLGHANPSTTRIYAKLTDEQLEEAHHQIDLSVKEKNETL